MKLGECPVNNWWTQILIIVYSKLWGRPLNEELYTEAHAKSAYRALRKEDRRKKSKRSQPVTNSRSSQENDGISPQNSSRSHNPRNKNPQYTSRKKKDFSKSSLKDVNIKTLQNSRRSGSPHTSCSKGIRSSNPKDSSSSKKRNSSSSRSHDSSSRSHDNSSSSSSRVLSYLWTSQT